MVKKQNVVGFEVIVGGGLGRTPMIGKVICEFITPADLLPYIEAIVSVWNLLGRRDNKYKARIKITVHEHGIDKIRALVEERFALLRDSFQGHDRRLLEQIRTGFAPPVFKTVPLKAFEQRYGFDRAFRDWVDTNTHPHRNTAYAIVSISLKTPGKTPGDASAGQMRVMAEIAERYGHNELRVSHEQNLILPHVHKSDLEAVHKAAQRAGLATANIGLISDIIACPGMDYCALATARSIPIAQEIATHFDTLKAEHDIGVLKSKSLDVSTPAAITTSVISAFWVWTVPGWKTIKSRSAVTPSRLRQSAIALVPDFQLMKLCPRLTGLLQRI
jgi:sulfite reductase (NADPH) hemoprotein beta-component